MNRITCGLISSYLTQDIKYYVFYKTFTRKISETLEKKYQTKSIESQSHLKRRFYRFQLKRGFFVNEHMNNYTKVLADLINGDVDVEKEDKAIIFLNALPDKEYEPPF